MDFSIQLGNFLYKHAFFIYQPLYSVFKKRQDAYEITLLKKHIHAGFTVLDIGANIGFYANILAEIVGENGKVHCFEPDKTNFNYLSKATINKKNIVTHHAAVGATNGTLKIYISDMLNVDHRTYEPEHYERVEEIPCLSIDDLFRDVQVDFIKMDIQGFEEEALKGMVDTLVKNPRIKLISEFWPYGLAKSGTSALSYFDELSKLGFTCYLIEKNDIRLLSRDEVTKMNAHPENKYYNLIAWRHV